MLEDSDSSPDSEFARRQPYGDKYDPDLAHTGAQYDDDLPVVCPSHTTEAKLLRKIDLKVLPFLCILYLLAFLDRWVTFLLPHVW